MSKLKTYSEFVNEALADAVKNPIKWKKIKNNAKKYQKARVAQALNDVDYAKRKEKASGELSPKQTEVLKQANKAKNSALADTASNISQRMNDLATTTGLKRVAQLAKTKSALAANAIVLKAADGEEAKRLKIKQKDLTKKATDAQKALADYEAESSGEAKEPKEPKSAIPDKTEKPETTEKPDKTKEADKGKDSESRPDDGKNSKADIIKRYQDMLDKEEDTQSPKAVKLKDKIASLQKESAERFMDPKFVSLLESELLEFSNSFDYVTESIAQKFARLRSNI